MERLFGEDVNLLSKIISITEEIKKYKASNENPPTIIFQLTAFPVHDSDKLDVLCGGRSKPVIKRICKFLDALKELEVQMFFVFKSSRNPLEDDKDFANSCRSQLHLAKSIDSKAHDVKSLLTKYKNDLKYRANITSDLLIEVPKYGTVVKVLEYNELFSKMLSLAAHHNAMAMVSDMTSYYYTTCNEKTSLWLARSLRYDDASIRMYDWAAVLKQYTLSPRQLSFISLMYPNRRESSELNFCVKKFKNNIKAETVKDFANYLNNNLIAGKHLDILVQKIFGRKCTKSVMDYYFALIVFLNQPEPLTNNYDSILMEKCCAEVYSIVNQNYNARVTCSYFDETRYSPLTFMDMMQPINARYYGLLVHFRKEKNDKISACTFSESKIRFVNMSLVVPDFEIPTLEELVDCDNNKDLDDMRYKILSWILSDKIEVDVLKNTKPNKYLIPVLALHFLKTNDYITIDEADLIFITVHSAIEDKIDDEINAPENLVPAMWHAVFLYLHVYNLVKEIFYAVGLEKQVTTSNFDGVYLHSLNEKFQANADLYPEMLDGITTDKNVAELRSIYATSF